MIPSPSIRLSCRVASLALLLVFLSGCDARDLTAFLEIVFLALIVVILLQLLLWVAMIATLFMCLLRLGQGKPSFFWGGVGMLLGLSTGILTFPLLTTTPHLLTFGSFALSMMLCYFGYRNVRGARHISRWERFGNDDDDDKADED